MIDMERFRLEKSTEQSGWWVLTDTENLIVLKFKEHNFNEEQKVTMLDESRFTGQPGMATQIARIMREMCDYMQANHYDLLF